MALLFYSQYDDPSDWKKHLCEALPGLEFRVWPEVGDPADIEAALVWKPPAGELRKYPNLKLIINLGAGVGSIVKDETLPPGVPISRIVDPEMSRMMSQFVLAVVLRHYRDFASFERAQRERRWHYIHPREAASCSVGVMGLGARGAEVARGLSAHGFAVSGWSRQPRAIDGVCCWAGDAQMDDFLRPLDIVVSLLPLTEATRGLCNADWFARLKPGAAFVNCGRGEQVVLPDLLQALERGRLRGAVLDVFEHEPLPADDPLWTEPGVVITPHMASSATAEVIAGQIVENTARVLVGQVPLHAVDRQRGY